MFKRSTVFVVSIAMGMLLLGCGQQGVSLEEYNKVVSERDEYKAQLDQINEALKTLGGMDTTDETEKEELEDGAGKEKPQGFVEDEVAQQLDITEYSYVNSIGHTVYCLVLKNNSPYTLSIEANVTTKDDEGNLTGANSCDVQAFESGYETCMRTYFDGEQNNFEYELSIKEEDYYKPVLSDLSYEISQTEKKIIVSATNNGQDASAFVEGTALFFKDGNLVALDYTYFVDDDNEIKPGKTINKELNGYSSYDDVKVYFTGRRGGYH